MNTGNDRKNSDNSLFYDKIMASNKKKLFFYEKLYTSKWLKKIVEKNCIPSIITS